ncbi:hypothetical protein Tco_0726275 [Tanacetum coccineum]|uniref:Uncharacterized protein n=1 Tax=Tanacetum coccineum TaxID=301880 RepID=A0ABQ4YF63_9ASTR
MSEPMPSIPTQSPFTYPNPNPSASPSFTQDDTSDSFIPEPTQPMPTYTQLAFSQPNQSFFSQPTVHLTQPSQTNHNNVQSQQFQQFQTASISANNAKFPYLEKDKYEIWQWDSPKRLGKDAKGNTLVHPSFKAVGGVDEMKEDEEGTMLKQQFTEFSVDRRKKAYKDMIYEDFDQVDQLEMEEIGIEVANGYAF